MKADSSLNIDKDISEEQLILFLKQKEKKALAYLYDHYGKAMYGVIYRILDNQEMAEEALQNSFSEIWDKIEQYDPEQGLLFTWILNISRNAAIEKTKTKEFIHKTKIKTLEDHLNQIAQNKTVELLDVIDLNKFINELDEDQKNIIDLIYFQGYSQSETAEKLDIPLELVQSGIRSAILSLRKWMLIILFITLIG